MAIKRLVRYFWLKLIRLSDAPHRVAFGVAVGVFINFNPLIGLHTLLAVAAILLLPINRIATIVTVWANTPWTVPFILAIDYKLGSWLLGYKVTRADFDFSDWYSLWAMGKGILGSMMLGGTILGVIGAAFAYFLSLRVTKFYQARRKRRFLLENNCLSK